MLVYTSIYYHMLEYAGRCHSHLSPEGKMSEKRMSAPQTKKLNKPVRGLNKLILYLHNGINNKDARHGMASKSNDMDSIDASGSKWVQVA